MAPTLIVSVDTEEEGLWSSQYRRAGNTVTNIRQVPRFQRFCEQFAVRPTYLVDTPVATDNEAVSILRSIQDEGRCEIGAHLHPWCGPPYEEEISRHNSYLCNLDSELQYRKLRELTDCIEHRFSRRPTSFRAGKYGLDIVGARHLADLGYLVDSSVLSFYDYSGDGGPDLSSAPYRPYRIGGNDLVVPCETGWLWEVPVSVGYSRKPFQRVARWEKRLHTPLLEKMRMVGICDRIGFVRKVKFSPEQSDYRRMNRLADCYASENAPCIVMLLHSSSLAAGCSPYVPDAAAQDRFYADLGRTLEYCRNVLQMPTATLTEFAMSLAD